ncbi:MAG: alcohol dehydrogenase catalytic domain-containing protein [Peptococcaceae bacterium]|nr:alcohol dehydrogenase catalytic domain-containing protein [Peptococcaceae bacterium]
MKAVVYHGGGTIRVDDVPKPEIQGPEDAIVRVTTTAICGSDLHILHGFLPVDQGTVIGHEFVGIVEEVGSAVTKVKPGDKVLSMAGVNCGKCRNCRDRLIFACENGGIFGCGPMFGNLQGVQAEYARVLYADETLEKIPEGLTDEQVLFVGDILATAYTGVMGVNPDGRGIQPGSVVAIFGAGPVGLCTVAVARLFGASQIIVTDMEDNRLEVAGRMGADKVINITRADPVASIMDITGGRGADLAVEAAGSPEAFVNCLAAAATGGTVSVIGVISQPVQITFQQIIHKNISIQTGLANVIHTKRLVSLIQAGKLDLTPIITHRLPLTEAVHAYEIFEKKLDGAIKVILNP